MRMQVRRNEVNMDNKLFGLMNWPEIEGVVYADTDAPQKILGGRVCSSGFLIQTFRPDAVEMRAKVAGKPSVVMTKMDEAGFFAALLPGRKRLGYSLVCETVEGQRTEYVDAYAFGPSLSDSELKKFSAGVDLYAYELLGAHMETLEGVEGVRFAVWAPNAVRVSVVGDFCLWDGRVYPMMKHEDSGVFELFIPGLQEDSYYKFEIKTKAGQIYTKADPYAFYAQCKPDDASIICDMHKFTWLDEGYMAKRSKDAHKQSPMSVLELSIGSFFRPEEDQKKCTYRSAAGQIAAYVKQMGYTHVELMPCTEDFDEESCGYHVASYFAPTSRYGRPEDLMYLINTLHLNGIGVILDWVPSYFANAQSGLSAFDGTHLYEPYDPLRCASIEADTTYFDYGKPQVQSFLLSNAVMWAEKYHVDGIKFSAVETMLYHDYGKNPGEWSANLYGGNENLDAVAFLKRINAVMHKSYPEVMTIAQEATIWPQVTGREEDSLGFDYKWNCGWKNDLLDFMTYDPIYRKAHYDELTYSTLYHYSDDYMLAISHGDVSYGNKPLVSRMPGNSLSAKLANVRAALGYLYLYPGKKVLFMGQDFAEQEGFTEGEMLDWTALEQPQKAELNDYVRALNQLYRSEPALYELDYEPQGFEWVDNTSADETILSFVRRAADRSALMVVVNFTPVVRRKRQMGVPFAGKYKEIFNSDAEAFGGDGNLNSRTKNSEKTPCDGCLESIQVTVPAMGVIVLRATPYTAKELEAIEAAKQEKIAREKRAEAKRLEAEAKRLEAEAVALEQKKRMVKKTGGSKSGSKVAATAKRKIPPKTTN